MGLQQQGYPSRPQRLHRQRETRRATASHNIFFETWFSPKAKVSTNQNPQSMTGEAGEAFRAGRHPPPFHESVANRPEAGDLTRWQLPTHSCGTVLELHQLRRVLTVI